MRNPIRPKNLSRRFAPWYAAGLLLVLLSRPTVSTVCVGLAPVALGLWIRAWGAGHLVKNERFTVTGPYTHLRHPLYLGTILIAVGFGCMLGGWPSLAALAVALPWFFLHYFPRKEQLEGERLLSRYGEVYLHYRAAVPALWPRLARWRPDPVDAEKLDTTHRWSLARYDRNNEHGTLLAVALAGLGIALWAALR
jgi:protein-S-isoprenylcysteine O-methyltransferase Ste14